MYSFILKNHVLFKKNLKVQPMSDAWVQVRPIGNL